MINQLWRSTVVLSQPQLRKALIVFAQLHDSDIDWLIAAGRVQQLAADNEAQSQLNQLDIKEAETQREYLRNVNQVNQLQAQLKALDSDTATQAEQDLTTATNRKQEIQETERPISQLELQLLHSSQIVSDYTGRLLEITAKPGQQLQPGEGIGAIAAQDASAKLVKWQARVLFFVIHALQH